MEKQSKRIMYLFTYKYITDQNLRYRFIIASGKIDAKNKFIMSINSMLGYYDFKKSNKLPFLTDGEIMESTIE